MVLNGTIHEQFNHHASHGKVGAEVGLALANGNYEDAAGTVVMAGIEKAVTSEIAEDLARGALENIGFAAKRLPVLGAAVTAGFTLKEAGSHALKHEWGMASGALLAGAAEAGGNFIGFGVGDAAREAVRGVIYDVAGAENAPEKSGVRTLGETGYHVAQKIFTKFTV